MAGEHLEGVKNDARHEADVAEALTEQRLAEARHRSSRSARDLAAQMRLAAKAVQDASRAEQQHSPPDEVEAALHSAVAQSRAARAMHDLATAESHYVHFMARLKGKLQRAVVAIDGSDATPLVVSDTSEDATPRESVLDELAGPGSELDALRAAVDASRSAA